MQESMGEKQPTHSNHSGGLVGVNRSVQKPRGFLTLGAFFPKFMEIPKTKNQFLIF